MAPRIEMTGFSTVEVYNGTQLRYEVTLSEASLGQITVNYRTLSSSPVFAGSDFGEAIGKLTFAPGETSKTIEVVDFNGGGDEFDEAVTVELYDPVNAEFASGNKTLREHAFILDDDGGVNLALFASSPVVIEGDSGSRTAVFKLDLSRAQTSPVTLSYATQDGTAKAGQDYTAKSGSVTFAPGQTSTTVSVALSPDSTFEGDETFNLVVDPIAGLGSGGYGATATATILDDDAPDGTPVMSMEALSALEVYNGVQLRYQVTLSEPSLAEVTVGYRTMSDAPVFAGADFGEEVGTLTFAPGETSKIIEVVDFNGGGDEYDEPVTVELHDVRNATFGPGLKTLREQAFILDGDGGVNLALSVSSPVIMEGEGGGRQAVFTLDLSRAQSADLSLDYATKDGTATAGEDYTAKNGSVTFAPGQTRAYVAVDLAGDTAFEGDEYFDLVVDPVTQFGSGGVDAVGTATILDDDAPDDQPIVSMEALSALEVYNGVQLRYQVTLSEPSLSEITVGYRTLSEAPVFAGADFDRTVGTLTFAPGETTKIIEVVDYNGGGDEFDEAVTVELHDARNATFGPGLKTLRESAFILDGDGGVNLALSVSSPVIMEGDDGGRQAVFTLDLSRPQTAELAFDFATKDGTAMAGDDYVAKTGSVTFAPGQTRAVVAVDLTGDTDVESAEFFQLVVDPIAQLGSNGVGSVGTATLIDDDTPDGRPTISMEAHSALEVYNGIQLRYEVMLSEPSVSEIKVKYRTLNDSPALAGTDFQETTGELTFAPGETSKTIEVVDYNGGGDEFDEAVIMELYNPTNASLAGSVTALRDSAFILDSDGGVNLSYSVDDVFVSEDRDSDAAVAEFIVRLSRPQNNPVSLTYRTVDGSAEAGQDYRETSGTLTFAPGQTKAAIVVPIIDDFLLEENEQFSLSFDAPPVMFDGAFTGAFATATISDNEIRGTEGDDNLTGTGFPEGIHGLGGDDTIVGLGGNDGLFGGEGDDLLVGGSGSDVLDGGPGRDRVSYGDAGAGVSVSLLAEGRQETGHGNDFIVRVEDVSGSAFGDDLTGGNGDNRLWGGAGDDTMEGGGGDDTLRGEDGDDSIRGGNGSDVISGEDGDDELIGGGGKDDISGGVGDDILFGGSKKDTLDGGTGNDDLAGASGKDQLDGGSGNDTLDGGVGKDRLSGGGGDDDLIGGGGNDTADYSDAKGVTVSLAESGRQDTGGAGSDRLDGIENLVGGKGKHVFTGDDRDNKLIGGGGKDRLVGGGGDDTLSGGNSKDFLAGGDGKDKLSGGGGNDRLEGGAGRDEIDGGNGRDKLAGGEDADRFVFGGNFGKDKIVDFEIAKDVIAFDPGSGEVSDFEAFLDAATQRNSKVFYDLDGDKDNVLILKDTLLDDLTPDNFDFG